MLYFTNIYDFSRNENKIHSLFILKIIQLLIGCNSSLEQTVLMKKSMNFDVSRVIDRLI